MVPTENWITFYGEGIFFMYTPQKQYRFLIYIVSDTPPVL